MSRGWCEMARQMSASFSEAAANVSKSQRTKCMGLGPRYATISIWPRWRDLTTTPNVLSMGARVVSQQLAEQIVDKFLSTEFEGGRHERRVAQLGKIEESESITKKGA